MKESGHAARPATPDSRRTREQLIARTLGLKAAWLDRRSLSCAVLTCAMADLRAIQNEAPAASSEAPKAIAEVFAGRGDGCCGTIVAKRVHDLDAELSVENVTPTNFASLQRRIVAMDSVRAVCGLGWRSMSLPRKRWISCLQSRREAEGAVMPSYSSAP